MHAIVTGSSRGVGQALVRDLLSRGWNVTGIARSEPDLEHERYRHASLDLADLAACEGPFRALVEEALATNADRLALVNNAGSVQPVRPLTRCEPQELATAMTLGLTTPMWMSGHVLSACGTTPLRIVNLSSGAAHSAYPGWGAYCAVKAGLHMVDRVLALEAEEYGELEGRDLAVLTYAPGVVATSMQAEIRATDEADFPRRQRFLDLHDNAQLVPESEPAREIADWLESSAAGDHAERRYGA